MAPDTTSKGPVGCQSYVTTLIQNEENSYSDKNIVEDISSNNLIQNNNEKNVKQTSQNEPFTPQIRWPDLTVQIFLHVGCVYGLYLIFTGNCRFYTALFGMYDFLL